VSVGSALNYGQEEGDQDKKKTIHKRKKRKTLADVQAAHVLKQASQQTTVGQYEVLAATLRQNNTGAPTDERMVVGDKPTMENVGESHQDVEMVEQNQEVIVMTENPASVLPAGNACNTTDLPVADGSGMKVFFRS